MRNCDLALASKKASVTQEAILVCAYNSLSYVKIVTSGMPHLLKLRMPLLGKKPDPKEQVKNHGFFD